MKYYCELNWLWIFGCIICLLVNKRWVVNAHGFVSWQYTQKEVPLQFPDVLDCLSRSNYEPDLKCVCINSKRISGKTKYDLTRQNSNKPMQNKCKSICTRYLLPNTVMLTSQQCTLLHCKSFMCASKKRLICGLNTLKLTAQNTEQSDR